MAKKIPQRMCVGCREMREKRQLIRIVRTAEGDAVLDRTGKMSGRGAYLCPESECLTKSEEKTAAWNGHSILKYPMRFVIV